MACNCSLDAFLISPSLLLPLYGFAIHGYLKLVQNHFERHSDEFNRSMEQYKKLFNLINQSSFDEFLDTFRKAYYELLKDIENINIKGNVK